MKFERKIANHQLWQLTGYSLIIIIILFSNSFPLPARAASVTSKTQVLINAPQPTHDRFISSNSATSTVQFESSSYSVDEGIGTAVVTLTRGVSSVGAITATVVGTDITTSSNDYNLTNFNGAGLDVTFNTTIGANGNINDVVVQTDGKILMVGDFTSYNGTARTRIARLNNDGTLDTSFDPGGGTDAGINRITLQPDGKILIAGGFTTYNGVTRNHIARLNNDGTLDTNFDSSTGPNADVTVAVVQADGKILIAGGFTTYNNTNRSGVARLNSDGTLDSSFDSSVGADNIVWDLAIQSADSKVIIVGGFINYNSTHRTKIARLNTDGSLDTSFDIGSGLNTNKDIWRVTLQPDGKVLIGGEFYYSNFIRAGFARLNSDGSLDTSFDPSYPYNMDDRPEGGPMVVQPDGKILVAGGFVNFNGVSRNHAARLNSDGSLDNTFDVRNGPNAKVAAIALQPDGRVLLGGQFTTYDDNTANRLVRLANTVKVSWGDGDNAPKTIKMTIVDDNIIEGDEQLALTLLSTTGAATLGSPVSTTLTILDNDSPPFTLTAVSGSEQTTLAGTAFSQPLVVQVSGTTSAAVTFSAPASGASGTFAGGATTFSGTPDANGLITTTTFTANYLSGSYVVTASAHSAIAPVTFSLTNQCNPLVVTSDGDDGSCGTLRAAIQYANFLIVSHDVTITISTPVITISSELPILQNPPGYSLILDGGCVASGGYGVPQTQLKAGTPNIGVGLQLANYIKVRGFKITGFSGAGLVMAGSNTLSCSWIGTTDGTTSAPNGEVGVSITGNNNTIGGSNSLDRVLISGNSGVGLGATGGTGNLAQNLWIGLAQDGTTVLHNTEGGLKVDGGEHLLLGRGNRIRS